MHTGSLPLALLLSSTIPSPRCVTSEAPILLCVLPPSGQGMRSASRDSSLANPVSALRTFATRAAAEKATHKLKFKGGKIKAYTCAHSVTLAPVDGRRSLPLRLLPHPPRSSVSIRASRRSCSLSLSNPQRDVQLNGDLCGTGTGRSSRGSRSSRAAESEAPTCAPDLPLPRTPPTCLHPGPTLRLHPPGAKSPSLALMIRTS